MLGLSDFLEGLGYNAVEAMEICIDFDDGIDLSDDVMLDIDLYLDLVSKSIKF